MPVALRKRLVFLPYGQDFIHHRPVLSRLASQQDMILSKQTNKDNVNLLLKPLYFNSIIMVDFYLQHKHTCVRSCLS